MTYPLLFDVPQEPGHELVATVRKRAILLTLFICVSKSFHTWSVACESQSRLVAMASIGFVVAIFVLTLADYLSAESTVTMWLAMTLCLYYRAASAGYAIYSMAATSVHILPIIAFVCGGRVRGVLCTILCQILVTHFWRLSSPASNAPDPDSVMIGITLSIVFCGMFSWFVQTLTLDLLIALQKTLSLEQEKARAQASFLATVCHEIRTPMVGIASLAELILAEVPKTATSTSTTQRLSDDLGTITSCSQDLLVFLNDFLDFTKSRAGALELHPTPIPLADLLGQVAKTFSSPAIIKGIDLVVVPPSPPCVVTLDVLRTKQILGNIVSNALKSTSQGDHVTLQASVDGNEVHLVVTDTGAGMDADTQASLFIPFASGHRGGERTSSSGLGLSVVHSLVSCMKGRIDVTSTLGEGSQFTIVLPVSHVNETATPPSVVRKRFSERLRKRKTVDRGVLLVEDNALTRKIVQRQCGKLGIPCRVAEDGVDALELIENDPDPSAHRVILMDMHMPRLDGVSTCRAIRDLDSRRSYSGRYIVAFTASVLPTETADYMAGGLDDILPKPCSLDSLQRCLTRAGLVQ